MPKSLRKTLVYSCAAAVGVLGLQSVAAARPDATKMTCQQAQQFVKKQGAVVMDTSATTFRRFVATRQYCEQDERLAPAYTATSDTGSCFIGYTCFKRPRDCNETEPSEPSCADQRGN